MTARTARALLASAAFGWGLAGPAMTPPGWAQTAALDIPAGPLEPALLALGQQAGLTFAYDSALTAGRSTGGAKGPLMPEAAVGRVLAGTGLGFAFTGPRSVRITAPAADGGAEEGGILLDTLTVTAQAGGATEGTGLYLSDAPTAAAAGLALTPRQTPQSMSIVTNQQLVDGADMILKDTMNQTPGITTASQYGDSRWSFYARGSEVTNLQYDGLAIPNAWWGQEGSPDDMVIYDRVEVVRGATGLMTGAGNPSASVNLVRKRPVPFPETSVALTGYGYGAAAVTLDASRALNGAGTVRGRALVWGLTGDTWREAQSHDTGLAYGAIDIDLTERTTLGLGLSYQKDRIDGYAWGGFWFRPDGGLYDFDATDNSGLDWEYLTRAETVGYADLTHAAENGWTFRLAGRLASSDRDRLASYASWDDPERLTRFGYLAKGSEESGAFAATANGAVTLFGRDHELAFGADWSRMKTHMTGRDYYSLVVADPARPDTTSQPKPSDLDPTVSWDTSDTVTERGLFASGRFEIAAPLHLILGGRLAWYESRNVYGDPSAGPSTREGYSVDAEPVPYIGAVYDLSEAVSVYVSYTAIFRPLAERGADGALLDPASGTNAEVGVKAGLLGDALEASFALFDSEIDGLPVALPEDQCLYPEQGCFSAADRVSTRGVEVELTGSPAEGWNLSLSYTYADSQYAAGPQDGERFGAGTVPRNLGKLSATYAFTGGALDGLTLGGAIRAQSGLYSDGTDAYGDAFRARQPGYAVVDLMGRYEVAPGTALQVNVDNAFDRLYLTGLDANWPNLFYGAPRTVSVALRHAF